jgi:hypothetical protein
MHSATLGAYGSCSEGGSPRLGAGYQTTFRNNPHAHAISVSNGGGVASPEPINHLPLSIALLYCIKT